MKHRYYIIANIDKMLDQNHSAEWPKVIGFSFENMSLLFLEGKGHGLQGGIVPINSFNPKDWEDFFVETNSLWFLDFIMTQQIYRSHATDILSRELSKKGKIEIKEY